MVQRLKGIGDLQDDLQLINRFVPGQKKIRAAQLLVQFSDFARLLR